MTEISSADIVSDVSTLHGAQGGVSIVRGANAHWRSSTGITARLCGGGDGGGAPTSTLDLMGVAGASISGSSSTVALKVHFDFGIVQSFKC